MSQAGASSSIVPVPITVVETLTGNSGGAVPPTGNNINNLGTGSIAISGNPGTSTLTTGLTGLTNHNVLVGAGTPTITNVAPSATAGIPLISNGVAADPSFGTATVPGGGTGATSFTAYSVICGGTTSTGALQNVSGVGTLGQVLTSNGAGALPTFQASGVAGPVSSTDRALATWNGTGGNALFNNSTTRIDSTGRSTNSAQPAFRVFLNANTAATLTGDGTIVTVPFDTVVFDQGSNFNTGTSTYTFPIAGIYLLQTTVFTYRLAGVNTVELIFATVNGAGGFRLYEVNYENMQVSGELVLTSSILYQAAASDTMVIRCAVGGVAANVGFGGGSSLNCFSGFLVC